MDLLFSSIVLNLIIYLIRCYQLVISPFLGSNCRFIPTCSQYGIESIRRFGVLKGTWMTFTRILKCHPWNDAITSVVPIKNNDNREKQ